MTRINPFAKISFLVLVIIFNAIPECTSILSDKRLCYDSKCSEPVSLARTTLTYPANEKGLLSVSVSQNVIVYSKGAGSRPELWGVEVNGKRGYIPKEFLKEYKILRKNLTYVVPTEIVNKHNNDKDKKDNNKNNLKDITLKVEETKLDSGPIEKKEKIEPSKSLSSYEVIDGTKIFKNDEASVEPSYASVTETLSFTNIKEAENNFSVNVNATVTQTELNTLAKVIELQNETNTTKEQLNVTTYSTVSNEQAKSEELFVGTKSSKEGNDDSLSVESSKEAEVDSPSVELSKEGKKGNKDSVTLELEHKKTESNVNSSTSNSKDKKNEENVNSSNVELEGEESKADVSSSVSESEKNEKTKADVNLENLELNDKEETEIQNVTIENIENKKENANVKPENLELNDKEETEIQSVTIENIENKKEKANVKPENLELNDKEETEIQSVTVENIENNKEKADVKLENLELNDKEETEIQSVTVENIESNKEKADVKPENLELNDKEENEIQNVTVENIENNKEKADVKPENLEFNDKEEKEIQNFTVENIENANISLPESELQKQAEIENVDNVNFSNVNQSTNLVSEGSDPISENQVTNDFDVIENSKEEVQQLAEEDVLKTDVQNNGYIDDSIKQDTTRDADAGTTRDENNQMHVQDSKENIVNNDVYNDNVVKDISSSIDVPMESTTVIENNNEDVHRDRSKELHSSQDNAKDIFSKQFFHEFRGNRNLLHVEEKVISNEAESQTEYTQNETSDSKTETLPEYEDVNIKDKVLHEVENTDKIEDEGAHNVDTNDLAKMEESTLPGVIHGIQFSDVCAADNECTNDAEEQSYGFISQDGESVPENSIMRMIKVEHTYWITLLYLSITAIATLVFSLGYYYIENMRRDSQLIAKINKLEKELLVSAKECSMLAEHLKVTEDKLNSMEDESFGSNEMVLSLRADLEASQNAQADLEDQVYVLERDLEGATEAGLELERMLREVLSSKNEVNPLAQSVEDLQARLNVQQTANESLTNSLNIKTHENEVLSADLTAMKKKYGELDSELIRITEEFKIELNKRSQIQDNLNDVNQQLEVQITQLSMDKTNLYKELKIKEAEVKDLVEVINQVNSNNLDIEKLYDVSHVKAEAAQLLEERDELKIRLNEVEGAHNLLEEHMKVVKEEVSSLSEQCKIAEKEKRDAETRLEVISNFFKEKEAQRQKEEALWLQKQGEVMSTVERIHTMQNEIQEYKQQIEMLKREIVDQEREYKAQISALETKVHEQWVMARQNERRLEESKAEAGQLRNRLTLIEKNINDADVDTKLHRLEANGETTTSPPLFIGAESSSSPIMFSGSSGVPPPPPPSFMHPLFPSYLVPPLPSSSGLPPYDVGQRPPPLGGRLSSPPPLPLHLRPPGRYEDADSPPPLISPPLLPPFNHRSHPPPFVSDHIRPPPPPPLRTPSGTILLPPPGTSHSWGEETLPPPRNSGFHPHQREQRARNHQDSWHSSGESLDKLHHSGKV